MSISVTIHSDKPLTFRDFANKLREQADSLCPADETDSVDVTATREALTEAPAKRGRPKKEPADDAEFDLGDDTDSTPEPEVTRNDVIDALKNYAAKHSKDKAGQQLAKFKVKSVKDLKETDFSKLLAALSR